MSEPEKRVTIGAWEREILDRGIFIHAVAWGRWVGDSGEYLVTSDAFERHWKLEGPMREGAAVAE